jgi:hypothetical protein
MLAPVFVLFVPGVGIRIGASLFFLLYGFITWRYVPRGIAFIRKDTDDAFNSTLFLLPTLSMLLVALLPCVATVVWSSGFLLFLGYFVLSREVYALA